MRVAAVCASQIIVGALVNTLFICATMRAFFYAPQILASNVVLYLGCDLLDVELPE